MTADSSSPSVPLFPLFRSKFFGGAQWLPVDSLKPGTNSNTASPSQKQSENVGDGASLMHHLQRPNLGIKLDLKTLPRDDGPPSETQLRRAKYKHFEKHCSEVAESIYVSGDQVARSAEILSENAITHVVNCVGFICKEWHPDLCTYRTLFLQDTPAEDILCVLYDTFEFMDRALAAGGRVLVHCSQGVSRSSTLAIAYLMWKNKGSYDETFAEVKSKRGVVNPNIGFTCQLLQWQKRRKGAVSRMRMYRVASHCSYAPAYLVPKVVTPPKCYPNNTYRELDPRGAFIIQTPSTVWVWRGARCPVAAAAAAEHHARLLIKYESHAASEGGASMGSAELAIISQGSEPAAFLALMDPILLGPEATRLNARRPSITGDIGVMASSPMPSQSTPSGPSPSDLMLGSPAISLQHATSGSGFGRGGSGFSSNLDPRGCGSDVACNLLAGSEGGILTAGGAGFGRRGSIMAGDVSSLFGTDSAGTSSPQVRIPSFIARRQQLQTQIVDPSLTSQSPHTLSPCDSEPLSPSQDPTPDADTHQSLAMVEQQQQQLPYQQPHQQQEPSPNLEQHQQHHQQYPHHHQQEQHQQQQTQQQQQQQQSFNQQHLIPTQAEQRPPRSRQHTISIDTYIPDRHMSSPPINPTHPSSSPSPSARQSSIPQRTIADSDNDEQEEVYLSDMPTDADVDADSIAEDIPGTASQQQRQFDDDDDDMMDQESGGDADGGQGMLLSSFEGGEDGEGDTTMGELVVIGKAYGGSSSMTSIPTLSAVIQPAPILPRLFDTGLHNHQQQQQVSTSSAPYQTFSEGGILSAAGAASAATASSDSSWDLNRHQTSTSSPQVIYQHAAGGHLSAPNSPFVPRLSAPHLTSYSAAPTSTLHPFSLSPDPRAQQQAAAAGNPHPAAPDVHSQELTAGVSFRSLQAAALPEAEDEQSPHIWEAAEVDEYSAEYQMWLDAERAAILAAAVAARGSSGAGDVDVSVGLSGASSKKLLTSYGQGGGSLSLDGRSGSGFGFALEGDLLSSSSADVQSHGRPQLFSTHLPEELTQGSLSGRSSQNRFHRAATSLDPNASSAAVRAAQWELDLLHPPSPDGSRRGGSSPQQPDMPVLGRAASNDVSNAAGSRSSVAAVLPPFLGDGGGRAESNVFRQSLGTVPCTSDAAFRVPSYASPLLAKGGDDTSGSDGLSFPISASRDFPGRGAGVMKMSVDEDSWSALKRSQS